MTIQNKFMLSTLFVYENYRQVKEGKMDIQANSDKTAGFGKKLQNLHAP